MYKEQQLVVSIYKQSSSGSSIWKVDRPISIFFGKWWIFAHMKIYRSYSIYFPNCFHKMSEWFNLNEFVTNNLNRRHASYCSTIYETVLSTLTTRLLLQHMHLATCVVRGWIVCDCVCIWVGPSPHWPTGTPIKIVIACNFMLLAYPIGKSRTVICWLIIMEW